MILVVNLNPTLQKTIVLPAFRENEVNRSCGHHLDASGKGVNLVRVVRQLGGDAELLCHSGGRDRGLFLELAAADGVRIHGPDSGTPIRYCYTLINRETGGATEIIEETLSVGSGPEGSGPEMPGPEGPGPEVPGSHGQESHGQGSSRSGVEEQVRREFHRLLPRCGLVVLSGTRAPGYSEDLYRDFTGAAREKGKRVLLDLQGQDLLRCIPRGPDMIKPNFAEFASTFITGGAPVGEREEDPELMEKAGREAAALSRAGIAVVLTRGPLPALCALGGEVFLSPPERVEAVNPIGSGDAFAAGFAVLWEDEGLPAPGSGEFAALFPRALAAGHRAAAANAANLRPGRIR